MSRSWIIPGLAVAVLIGAAVDRVTVPTRADNSGFHQRVKAAGEAAPLRVGPWVGVDTPPTARAEQVLKPNLLLSRSFTNVENGETATVLVVHCGDARDMVNHYPPICYPNAGFKLMSTRPKDWAIAGRRYTGTEYHFVRDVLGRSSSVVVANCMLLPGGTARDMEAVAGAARDIERRFRGVGQVQVLVDADVPERQRDEIVVTLLGGYAPVADAICAPVEAE